MYELKVVGFKYTAKQCLKTSFNLSCSLCITLELVVNVMVWVFYEVKVTFGFGNGFKKTLLSFVIVPLWFLCLTTLAECRLKCTISLHNKTGAMQTMVKT